MLHLVPTAASETTTSSSHNTTTTNNNNNSTSHNTNTNSHGNNNNNSHNAPLEPALAVIFPWFSEIVGVIVFFILSRYLRRLPYTAVLFIIGTFMGVGAHRLERTDQLTESILMWSGINSEVLLLVFLPGLIFRDAYSLNVHLFFINQILVFAFPMVLAGTTLTALVAFYVFPYNWTFTLSILESCHLNCRTWSGHEAHCQTSRIGVRLTDLSVGFKMDFLLARVPFSGVVVVVVVTLFYCWFCLGGQCML